MVRSAVSPYTIVVDVNLLRNDAQNGARRDQFLGRLGGARRTLCAFQELGRTNRAAEGYGACLESFG